MLTPEFDQELTPEFDQELPPDPELMTPFDQQVARLKRRLLRCVETWYAIADRSGLEYSTVCGFAHGWTGYRNPRLTTLNALYTALPRRPERRADPESHSGVEIAPPAKDLP